MQDTRWIPGILFIVRMVGRRIAAAIWPFSTLRRQHSGISTTLNI